MLAVDDNQWLEASCIFCVENLIIRLTLLFDGCEGNEYEYVVVVSAKMDEKLELQ